MFRKKTRTENGPVPYPAGTFVKTEKGYFYIFDNGIRYRLSDRVIASWRPARVVETTEKALSKHKITAKMKFRNGSLIWNISDGRIYLIEKGKRRWIKNPVWFERLGLDPSDLYFNMKRIQHVSQDEVDLHELGRDLD